MKGLFDLLNSDDPAIRQGLLQAGVALLGSRGNFGQSLGQGLGAGLLGTQQFRDRQSQMERQKLQDQLLKGKVGDMERQQAALQSLPSPQLAASQSALAGGGGPTVENAAKMQPVDPRAQSLYQLVQAGVLPPDKYIESMYQSQRPEYKVVNGALVRIDGDKVSEAYRAPKEEAIPTGMRMGPNGLEWIPEYLRGKTQIAQAGAPGNVTYAAPVLAQMPDGTVGYVQPGNRAGAPPQVMKDPATGKPLVRPKEGTDKDPTEFQSKAALYFKSMATATQTLDSLERTNAWRPSIAETAAPGETAKTLVQTEARQKYTQAQKQWIDSINRVRSGANLPELEYDRAVRTFFPVYGEGENLKAQKAAARRQEEAAMQQAAGRAIKQPQPGGVVDFSELK